MACALSIWLTLMHSEDTEEIQKVMAMRLKKFDKNLGVLLEQLKEDDLLILTADHGNDPTYTGSDHTREYVPFIAYSKQMENGGRTGRREHICCHWCFYCRKLWCGYAGRNDRTFHSGKISGVQTNQVNHLLQLRRVISSNCRIYSRKQNCK